MSHAEQIAQGLGATLGRKPYVVVRCPAHDDSSPSLAVSQTRDGRALVHCHAGCSQLDVIAALRKRGLWEGEAKGDPSYPGRLTKPHDGIKTADERERLQYACDLWEQSDPIDGTLAETYLRSRKISLKPWPDDLGFIQRLGHRPSKTFYPALIAVVRNEKGWPTAVQRTWLLRDGSGKAPIEPPKMTVGPMGRGAVRLGRPGAYMGLAEGVETALSASMIYGIPVWATLSANRLDKITLPTECESLVIFADRGKVGMDAANDAAQHYERAGLTVDVMPPSVHFGDTDDFNSALQARP